MTNFNKYYNNKENIDNKSNIYEYSGNQYLTYYNNRKTIS